MAFEADIRTQNECVWCKLLSGDLGERNGIALKVSKHKSAPRLFKSEQPGG